MSALASLFAAIDAQDATGFAAHLTDDAEFRFANAPAVRGRADITAAVAAFFSSVRKLAHELHVVHEGKDWAAMHGTVTYTRHNGSTLTVPFANHFELRDGLIQDYRIFGDFSALYALDGS